MFKWEKQSHYAPTDRADFIVCWIEALLDLKIKQTKERLKDNKGFCCLGVATDKFNPAWVFDSQSNTFRTKQTNGTMVNGVLPDYVSFFLLMDPSGEFNKMVKLPKYGRFSSLASMNDSGVSFRQIAKVIQEYCSLIFKDLSPEEQEYIKAYKIPTRESLRQAARNQSLKG